MSSKNYIDNFDYLDLIQYQSDTIIRNISSYFNFVECNCKPKEFAGQLIQIEYNILSLLLDLFRVLKKLEYMKMKSS